MQRPAAPVIRPVTSAAKPAEPSCAVSTKSIPPRRIASIRGSTLPLGIPNPCRTPAALRVATIRSALFMQSLPLLLPPALSLHQSMRSLRGRPLTPTRLRPSGYGGAGPPPLSAEAQRRRMKGEREKEECGGREKSGHSVLVAAVAVVVALIVVAVEVEQVEQVADRR